jgi:DNA-binding transcriptional LysR family regulator
MLKGCETRSLAQEKLLVMALPTHEIMQQDPQKLTLKTLSQYKIILSHRYRRYVLSAFEEKGIFCDIYCECQDARTALTLAENGLGVAVLPASMQKLTSRVVCREIIDVDLTTEILLAWRKERLPAEVQEFLAIW